MKFLCCKAIRYFDCDYDFDYDYDYLLLQKKKKLEWRQWIALMQKADVRKKRTLFPVLGAQRPVCISPINDKRKQALRLNGKIIIELFFREIYEVNLLICFK